MNRERFDNAATFKEYLETVDKNRELWHGVYEHVRVSEEVVAEASRIPGGWHLIALSEDWCGDAVNTLPVIARLAEAADWDLRVFGRDDNPDLMDGHLTNGAARSPSSSCTTNTSTRSAGGVPVPKQFRRGSWTRDSQCPRLTGTR